MRRFAAEHGAPGALAMTAADLGAAGLDGVAGVSPGTSRRSSWSCPASDPPTSVAAARRADRDMVTVGPW